MPNTFKFVTDWLANESLRGLLNKTILAQFANTDYNKEFNRAFPIGETVSVKFPQRFIARDGLGYVESPINRRSTTVTVDQIFGVDFGWDSIEKALNMERSEESIRKEYLEPAMSEMATQLDLRLGLYMMQNTPNVTGSLGTTPTTMGTYGRARTLMMENSCPPGERGMMITPAMNEAAVTANAALFNPDDEISRQFREGSVGKYAGSRWFETMNLRRHLAGTWAGAVTVTSAPVTGATSIIITATAGDTFKKGDIISIAAVNNANPSTRQTTNRAKTFVVTSALTAAGGGADILNIYPPIFGPGDQYQNVDVLPVAAAALTLWPGTASPNGKEGVNGLNIHRDAFALVGVEMELPKSAELSFQKRDPQTGLSIRFVRAWDQHQSKMTNRFDFLGGFGVLYAENCAVRVASLN